jgi:hexulose-6-phosphate isomerase
MMGTFPDKKLSTLEKFQLLKEAGFEGAEPPSHMDRDEVLKARDAAGLHIGSVVCETHWVKPLSDPNPAVRAVTVEAMKVALEDAKTYGAPAVLLVPAVVNATVSYADAYERSHAEILKLVPVAEKLGVKIAIENVWNNFLLSPMEAARYVDEFKSPMVGWHFDIGNVISIGWPEQWIRILGHRIATLHVKEFTRKKMNEQGLRKGFAVDYLEGDNDWPAVMKALDDVGYQGWAIAEAAYHPPGMATADRLKEISERMDKIFAG